jgi:hypothetical protein
LSNLDIEKMDGTVVKERLHPSEHAEGKAVDAPWDVLDRAYFKFKRGFGSTSRS